MMRPFVPLALLACSFLSTGCSNGSSATAPTNPEPPPVSPPIDPGRLVLAVGSSVLTPVATPADVDATQVDPTTIAAHYVIETPAGAPFAFDLLSWAPTAVGTAQVTVRHLRDGVTAANGIASLLAAGLAPSGPWLSHNDTVLGALDLGVVRMTLQGRITANQQLLVYTDSAKVAIVDVVVGVPGPANTPANPASPLPAEAVVTTPYTSNSWRFGAPAVASDRARPALLVHEGHHGRPADANLFELRLREVDPAGTLRGGAVAMPAGSLRYGEHAVGVRGNVLATVRGENEGLRIALSFDRGTTFVPGPLLLGTSPATARPDLKIGADGTLVVAGWRLAASGPGLELVAVEGVPATFEDGEPRSYAFTPVRVLATAPAGHRPLAARCALSANGDLAVAFGTLQFAATQIWQPRTSWRCAVQRLGRGLVVRDLATFDGLGSGIDVTAFGTGLDLRFVVAHDAPDGVRMLTGDEAGFAASGTFGLAGDREPRLAGNESDGARRLDLLWLAPRAAGRELHRAAWSDWPVAGPELSVVVDAACAWQDPVLASPLPGLVYSSTPGLGNVLTTRQVAERGFAIARDRAGLVLVVDEVTADNEDLVLGSTYLAPPSGGLLPPVPFVPLLVPPPLVPGLTAELRAPNGSDVHQLRVLRLP